MTGQDEIPYTIDGIRNPLILQYVREEVVDIGTVGERVQHANMAEAVKAFAFLIAVERAATRRDICTLSHPVRKEQREMLLLQ